MSMPKQFSVGTKWTRCGFSHEVVARNGDVALVRRTHPDIRCAHWEVCVVRWSDGRPDDGQGFAIESGEFMPSAEQWGTYGWTYSDAFHAMAKMESEAAKREPRCPLPLTGKPVMGGSDER